jgi:L-lactate dehydrogenase complex protein LldG
MAVEAIERFVSKYETLSGRVHLADSVESAAEAVLSVLREDRGTRLAAAELPEALMQALERRCADAGVDLLKPPYDGRTLPGAIDAAHVGVSWAEFAVADAGALVEFATNDATRLVSTLPRIHLGVVRAMEIKETLMDAGPRIRKFMAEQRENATVTFISGPSRTADIEMRLTLGVHGPEMAHAVILDP